MEPSTSPTSAPLNEAPSRAELQHRHTGAGQLMTSTSQYSLEDQSTFGWGNSRFSLQAVPQGGGYVIRVYEAGRAPMEPFRFKDPDEIPAMLQNPENEAFLLAVVRLMTPAAPKTIHNFVETVKDRIRQMPSQTPAPAEASKQEAILTESVGVEVPQINADLYYYVSQQNGERSVSVSTGSLLKESAEMMGRLTGSAVKNPANRHEVLVLTGAEVLSEGLKVL